MQSVNSNLQRVLWQRVCISWQLCSTTVIALPCVRACMRACMRSCDAPQGALQVPDQFLVRAHYALGRLVSALSCAFKASQAADCCAARLCVCVCVCVVGGCPSPAIMIHAASPATLCNTWY